MSTDTASDFLLGGGGKSVAFDNVGDSVTGTIEATEVRQQTDIQHGTPLTWDNGDPKMQLVVTLQTNLRDPAIDNDDGKRNVYIKGSKKAGTRSTHDAVASAVRAAGASALEVGGTLTLTYAGTEPSSTRGFSDRKLWTAVYVPASAGFLGTQPQQQVVAVQPAGAAQPTSTSVAPGSGPTPEQIAAVKAAGLDPAVVFAGQQV